MDRREEKWRWLFLGFHEPKNALKQHFFEMNQNYFYEFYKPGGKESIFFSFPFPLPVRKLRLKTLPNPRWHQKKRRRLFSPWAVLPQKR